MDTQKKVTTTIKGEANKTIQIKQCSEQTDNPEISFDDVTIDRGIAFNVIRGEGKLKDMIVLKTSSLGQELVFITYFAWDNREPGKMKVWIDYEEQTSLYTLNPQVIKGKVEC